MGAYIPSYHDGQIRQMLTDRFSTTPIGAGHPAHVPGHNENFMEQMRRHHALENMFQTGASAEALERVAHRLAHSLGPPKPTDPNARRRWYWLLNAISTILPTVTADKIRDALSTALAPGSGINSIQFDLHYDGNNPLRYDLQVVDAGSVRTLTLISNKDKILPDPTPNQQPLNPSPGAGERPINNAPVP